MLRGLGLMPIFSFFRLEALSNKMFENFRDLLLLKIADPIAQ